MMIGAAALAWSACGMRAPGVVRQGARPRTRQCLRLCAVGGSSGETEDWRELRARLVAQERAAQQQGDIGGFDSSAGYVYESPLIEQGSVILGGTQQEFGFALRQQYFHKCVMLLLQHDEGFTKGIILNRPSAFELDGWRVWFGGDVAEGGMFRGSQQAKGEREIICLHQLEGELAERHSMSIIKGVSYTTLEGAKALLAEGAAEKEDFWVFVGYAGWAPKQLQGEVERDSWFLASADSGTLLKELLRQGTELPPPSTGSVPGDGLATWEKLMASIGRGDEVERTRGSLSDRMLTEWCRVRLIPHFEAASAEELPIKVGTVLRTGSMPADRVLLNDQFLHKALLLCVHELNDGMWIGAVLNRPTANLVQFHSDGKPRRCISFGGDGRLRGNSAGLEIDSYGLLWLGQASRLERVEVGTPLGDSGLRRVSALDAAESIKAGETQLNDFVLVDGVVCFTRNELRKMLDAGQMHAVRDATPIWPQVWELSDARNAESASLSDGTGVWWAAAQLENQASGGRMPAEGGAAMTEGGESSDAFDVLLTGLQVMPPSHLADEALAQWLKFFAGHRIAAEES